jgi:hypothetical protein
MGRVRIIFAVALIVLGALSAAPAKAQFLSAADQARETPGAFAQRIAGLYGPEGDWAKAPFPRGFQDYEARVKSEFYDPGFEGLIEENRRLEQRWGDLDLDHDPLCHCQQVHIRLSVEQVDPKGPDAAEAHMASCEEPGAGCEHYVLVLTRTAGAWRVYDAIEQGDSVRAFLEGIDVCLRSNTEAEMKACLRRRSGQP